MEHSGDLYGPGLGRAGGAEAPRRVPVVLDGPPTATRAYIPAATLLSVPELSLLSPLARAQSALVWLGTPADSLATPTPRFDRSQRRWLTFVLLDTGRVFCAPVADWAAIAGAYEVVGLAYGGLGAWRRWEPAIPAPVIVGCVPWVSETGATTFSTEQAHVLACAPDGTLYAFVRVDELTTGVMRFDPWGTGHLLFNLSGGGPVPRIWDFYSTTHGEFGLPMLFTGLAVSADTIYVAGSTGSPGSAGSVLMAFNLDGSSPRILAGNASATGYNGDGLASTRLLSPAPSGLALAPDGASLLLCDGISGMVRQLTFATGQLTRVLGGEDGSGNPCVPVSIVGTAVTWTAGVGDGGPATAVGTYLSRPTWCAQAANGDIYAGSALTCEVRKVTAATGHISTVPGSGGTTATYTASSGSFIPLSGTGFGCPFPGAQRDPFIIPSPSAPIQEDRGATAYQRSTGALFDYHCGQVYRNGVAVTSASYGGALPLDAGSYRLDLAIALAVAPDGTLYAAVLRSGTFYSIVRFGCPPPPVPPLLDLYAGGVASFAQLGPP